MIMYFAFKTYPGGGAFALFFHPHPREFATQNKKSANARGLARGGGGWAQLELTDALQGNGLSISNLFLDKRNFKSSFLQELGNNHVTHVHR